jgi:cation:H+ antiporter
MSVYATRKFLKTDYVVMLGSIVLVFILSLDHLLSRIEGFILAALYLAYIYYLGRLEHFVAKVEINHRGRRVWPHFLSMGFFMLLLFLFSDLAVRGVHGISVQLSMQDSLIGAIVLGIGTALPELAMVIVAIRRGLAEMSVGVLVGSNITNPLFAAGIGALISTYSVAEDILFFDLPIWFLVSLVPLFFLWSGKRLQRKEAVLLIFLYVLYVLLRFMVVPYMF